MRPEDIDGTNPEALVKEFHRVYEAPVNTGIPTVDFERVHMRMNLIAEEYAELVGAIYGIQARQKLEDFLKTLPDDNNRDLVEAADALADMVYVIYGMALESGINLPAVLQQVQASNLSKLGEDGKPIRREDGKILKGPKFFPPNVKKALENRVS